MAVLKVIDPLANLDISWEDATKNKIKHTVKSMDDLHSNSINKNAIEKGIDNGEFHVPIHKTTEIE